MSFLYSIFFEPSINTQQNEDKDILNIDENNEDKNILNIDENNEDKNILNIDENNYKYKLSDALNRIMVLEQKYNKLLDFLVSTTSYENIYIGLNLIQLNN